MNINFQGGRLPVNHDKPKLKFSTFLDADAAYQAPNIKDWASRVVDWPMYLNDQIGDCTCAGIGHIIQALTTYGQGKTATISDNDVLTAYEAVSGFDPRTGRNDNGAVMQDVLNYWRKAGVGGHKILAFAAVDFNNEDELKQALSLFGNLYLGINFPDSAMDQFNNDEPWDVVRGARNEGGHAINGVYYDETGWKVVTWGRVQPMTQAFFDKYVEEAWVVISPEWLAANGNNPDGVSMELLGENFTRITGETSPFVLPTPAPAPVAEDKAAVLQAAAQEWLSHRHSSKVNVALIKPLQEWLNTRT